MGKTNEFKILAENLLWEEDIETPTSRREYSFK